MSNKNINLSILLKEYGYSDCGTNQIIIASKLFAIKRGNEYWVESSVADLLNKIKNVVALEFLDKSRILQNNSIIGRTDRKYANMDLISIASELYDQSSN